MAQQVKTLSVKGGNLGFILIIEMIPKIFPLVATLVIWQKDAFS